MKNLLKEVTLGCIALLACFNTMATENKNNKPGAEEEFNSVEMIMHHISDAHDFHFLDYTDSEGVEHAVSIPLPVILYTNNGLVCFMSSAFHHNDDGTYVVSKKGTNFVKYHEKIYQLNDGASSLEFDEQHHPLNAVKPIDVSITKNVFSMLLSLVLLLTLFGAAGKSAKKKPGAPRGILAFLEPIIVFIREDIIIPNVGE